MNEAARARTGRAPRPRPQPAPAAHLLLPRARRPQFWGSRRPRPQVSRCYGRDRGAAGRRPRRVTAAEPGGDRETGARARGRAAAAGARRRRPRRPLCGGAWAWPAAPPGLGSAPPPAPRRRWPRRRRSTLRVSGAPRPCRASRPEGAPRGGGRAAVTAAASAPLPVGARDAPADPLAEGPRLPAPEAGPGPPSPERSPSAVAPTRSPSGSQSRGAPAPGDRGQKGKVWSPDSTGCSARSLCALRGRLPASRATRAGTEPRPVVAPAPRRALPAAGAVGDSPSRRWDGADPAGALTCCGVRQGSPISVGKMSHPVRRTARGCRGGEGGRPGGLLRSWTGFAVSGGPGTVQGPSAGGGQR